MSDRRDLFKSPNWLNRTLIFASFEKVFYPVFLLTFNHCRLLVHFWLMSYFKRLIVLCQNWLTPRGFSFRPRQILMFKSFRGNNIAKSKLFLKLRNPILKDLKTINTKNVNMINPDFKPNLQLDHLQSKFHVR